MILLKIGRNLCTQPAKCSNYANNFGIGMYAEYNACNTRIASDGKHQFLGRDIVLFLLVLFFFRQILNLISTVGFSTMDFMISFLCQYFCITIVVYHYSFSFFWYLISCDCLTKKNCVFQHIFTRLCEHIIIIKIIHTFNT